MKTTMTRTPSRRGFAMAVAISFIPIATVAMMSVGMFCCADYRRTTDAAAGAQLRQLLMAGAVDARSHLGGSETQWATPLPEELTASGAIVESRLTLEPNGDRVMILAKIGNRHAGERIQFSHQDGKWSADAAELLDQPNE